MEVKQGPSPVDLGDSLPSRLLRLPLQGCCVQSLGIKVTFKTTIDSPTDLH